MAEPSLPGVPQPVDAALPQLLAAIENGSSAVLSAAPGAGKTTRVPFALAAQPWCSGMVLVLEPRRIAARAAAGYMAGQLKEKPGETVGYRVRLESRASTRTRILFVTEGVFARMIMDDPELPGVSALIFDEFHERSLDADLGLALALDVQRALRPELRILVMSATLETGAVARMLGDAPVIESPGRSFDVELRYEERGPNEPVEDAVARTVRRALAQEQGSVLAFLPGQKEIRRTAERLAALPADVRLFQLYGAVDPREQDAAIRPPAMGERKVVLATSIAETSLTIDGVRIVVDSGLKRVLYTSREPGSPGWKPCGPRVRPLPSAPAGRAAPRPASPSGCGANSKIPLCRSPTRRKSWKRTWPVWRSTLPPGVSPTRRNCHSSTCRPRPPGPRPSNC